MDHDYILHSSQNCSNCKYCIAKEEFPYFCSLKNKYTGMLIRCEKWEQGENRT